ncbi:MAG TPA: alpha/beta fold hydrolase [Actinomycetota bacterium]|nr:alpha/beta fold hydrolase [Actinomycetota bacterium]
MIYSTRSVRRFYGPAPSQFGVLTLPAGKPPYPAAVLLHGGFWHLPWGLDLMSGPAQELAGRGIAVWNLEYRRVGEPGGGWPGTLEDVLNGFDALAALPEGRLLDVTSVAVAGHSAGGQLALWLAGERASSSGGHPAVGRVAALAAVTDLQGAWEHGVGSDAVEALLGGPPQRHPARYRAASPVERLPLGVPQLVVHGERDRIVPPAASSLYAQRAKSLGDDVVLRIVPRSGHMDVVNPRRPPWRPTAEWLATPTDTVV